MSTTVNGSVTLTGSAFQRLLTCDDIQPGSDVSYETCKEIYLYHPLALRLVEGPITLAQSQAREISVRSAPSSEVADQFVNTWAHYRADAVIKSTMAVSRTYGIGTLALLVQGQKPSQPINLENIHDKQIGFNVFDPLNTSGTLTMDQDPNSIRFQKPMEDYVGVQGTQYHPSRVVIKLNEQPIYIAWSSSAFGYVGRSVFQRALFPLKSYINTMVANDMVSQKVGIIIAMLKAPGSIVNNIMQAIGGIKRQLLKEARNGNVISITTDEKIESLNLQNLEGPLALARSNIQEDIAAANDMPPQILNSHPFAGGLSEGKEDAKTVSKYVDRFRDDMQPLYTFMDRIIMRMAWTPEFYETIKKKYPEEYKGVTFNAAFYSWMNSFTAVWPSLLVEPESEKIKVSDTKLKAIISLIQVLAPMIDPENRMELIKWAVEAITEDTKMFSSTIDFDYDQLAEYVPQELLSVISGTQGVEQYENNIASEVSGKKESKGKEEKEKESKKPSSKPSGKNAEPILPPEKGVQATPGRAKIKLATADSIEGVNEKVVKALDKLLTERRNGS